MQAEKFIPVELLEYAMIIFRINAIVSEKISF